MMLRRSVAAALLGSACSWAASGEPASGGQQRLHEVRRRIEATIGRPAARDVSRCGVVPFGAKPCGGPWTYLVYSRDQTDPVALEKLVKEYNDLQRRMNAEQSRVSDCMFVGPPAVVLVGGVCTSGAHGRR